MYRVAITTGSTIPEPNRYGGAVNLTFGMHEESRYNEALFDELADLLTAPGGAGDGVEVHQMHRAPGPVNAQFAVLLVVASARGRWSTEFSVREWPNLPDQSPPAMARVLVEEVRALLAAGPSDGEADRPRRRFFRRR
jgi:hypothetical protein